MELTNRLCKTLLGAGLAVALTLVFVSAHQALAQGTWETSEPPDLTLTPIFVGRAPIPCLAAAAINGKLFVEGGCLTPVLEVYDPAKESGPSGPTPWETKPPDPFEGPGGKGRPGAGVAVANNKLYVVGGCIDTDCTGNVFVPGPAPGKPGTSNLLEVFDPSDGSWSTLAPMPTPRVALAFEEIGGKLYAVGGNSFASVLRNTLEVFDPNPPDNNPLGS